MACRAPHKPVKRIRKIILRNGKSYTITEDGNVSDEVEQVVIKAVLKLNHIHGLTLMTSTILHMMIGYEIKAGNTVWNATSTSHRFNIQLEQANCAIKEMEKIGYMYRAKHLPGSTVTQWKIDYANLARETGLEVLIY